VLRALIVDDEPLARERLRSVLRTEASIELVGECGSGTEAIATIRSTALDLLFLDVQMPRGDGMQVLAEIPAENRSGIIFATAHERYALNAFETEAVDYLLKPFDRERLLAALDRAREFHRARQLRNAEPKPDDPSAVVGAPKKQIESFAVRMDGRLVFLKPDEIVWIEADDNCVIFHLGTGRLMLRETMTAFVARLSYAKFPRVNRSAFVHLDRIKELQPTLHGDYAVLLNDGTKFPLSRSLRGELIKFASAGT